MTRARTLIGICFLTGIALLIITRETKPIQDTPDMPAAQQEASNIPLPNAADRVHKKPFGIRITPTDSPVRPERFSGYHTGVDFELTEGEVPHEMQVRAICDGILVQARTASGYGGVAVQSCYFDGQTHTVVYGHIHLASIRFKPDEYIRRGDIIANLGTAFSPETDNERAHLHLSVHKGPDVNIRGYVSAREELSSWVDPLTVLTP